MSVVWIKIMKPLLVLFLLAEFHTLLWEIKNNLKETFINVSKMPSVAAQHCVCVCVCTETYSTCCVVICTAAPQELRG